MKVRGGIAGYFRYASEILAIFESDQIAGYPY